MQDVITIQKNKAESLLKLKQNCLQQRVFSSIHLDVPADQTSKLVFNGKFMKQSVGLS